MNPLCIWLLHFVPTRSYLYEGKVREVRGRERGRERGRRGTGRERGREGGGEGEKKRKGREGSGVFPLLNPIQLNPSPVTSFNLLKAPFPNTVTVGG